MENRQGIAIPFALSPKLPDKKRTMNTMKENCVCERGAAAVYRKFESMLGDQHFISLFVTKNLDSHQFRSNDNGVNSVSPYGFYSLQAMKRLSVASNEATIGPKLSNCATRFTAAEHVTIGRRLMFDRNSGIAIDAGFSQQRER
jgi:hypothetical protein